MSKSDLIIYVIGLLGSLVIFIGSCVGLALKIQSHISKEFKNHRRLMYAMFKIRDRAIRRLEFWAVRQPGPDRFQPGAEPLELQSADQLNGHDNGNDDDH